MKRAAPFLCMAVLALCLAFGLARLFAIRFEKGNIYPAYSSLRTDGLGTKALCESLSELIPTQRNWQPLPKLEPGHLRTIFLLGLPYEREWSETDFNELEQAARGGARVVIGFLPIEANPNAKSGAGNGKTAVKENDKKKPGSASKKKEGETEEQEKMVNWGKELGIEIAFLAKPPKEALTTDAAMEPRLSWHSILAFVPKNQEWSVIYSARGKPVLIQRRLGAGSLVLAADSYPFSNEALSKERAPRLLASLVGSSESVLFDETHLGIEERPGIASLIRRYRLHGMVAGLLLVAALFVWRGLMPLVPSFSETGREGEPVAGRGSDSGVVSLLSRNIPPREAVLACVGEWKRSFAHRVKPDIIPRIEALAEAGGNEPVRTFRSIAELLKEKKICK